MQYIAQRIGIFVKQRKKSKGLFKTRFFVLDNNHNLVYSSNQASIEKVIKSSDTISEIIYKCSSRKKINIKKAKVGPLKSFYTIDQIPIANKNCFELVLDNSKDLTPVSLIIFSFQDEQIFYLHDFIKNYDSYIDKFEKSGFQQVNIVKKIHSAYVEEEKDGGLKTDISSQPSKDEDDIREKFKILSKIIAELDQNEAETEKIETLEVFEDLKAQPNEVKVEEIELLQLSNGNSFSGKMRNGKPHGQGTEFLQDGTSYVGEFRNGKWHGLGYMVNSNLDMTYAEFINGRPVGI